MNKTIENFDKTKVNIKRIEKGKYSLFYKENFILDIEFDGSCWRGFCGLGFRTKKEAINNCLNNQNVIHIMESYNE